MPKKCITKDGLNYNNIDTFRCPYCKGKRFKELSFAPNYMRTCPLCNGEGIVDWIKKITGYSEEVVYDTLNFWKDHSSENIVVNKQINIWNVKGVIIHDNEN